MAAIFPIRYDGDRSGVMLRRRTIISGGVSALALIALMRPAASAVPNVASRTEEEWHALLSPAQYTVLRQAQTEQPYSSPLTSERRRGTYTCGGCGQRVFSSSEKYDSRTGWPSFRQPLPRAVREKQDHSQGLDRTKVECLRCGCHLGHVFGDGPPPKRLRYCINGAGLNFIPA
jgi:peptide-methionine (R)-S-oxide reductase